MALQKSRLPLGAQNGLMLARQCRCGRPTNTGHLMFGQAIEINAGHAMSVRWQISGFRSRSERRNNRMSPKYRILHVRRTSACIETDELESNISDQTLGAELILWDALHLASVKRKVLFIEMGTTFTSFRGYGFWSRDGEVAAWMANLVREIDRLPMLADDQRVFRDDLILQASLQLNGMVSDCLEHVDRSEHLRLWIIGLGRRSLQEYIRWGEYIDGNWLEGLMKAEGSVDTGRHFEAAPILSEPHTSYGEKWLDLLQGSFVPLPLHPTGKFHATGEIEADISRPSDTAL